MATPSNRLPDKDQELSVRQGAFKFEPHSSDLMSASNNITSDRPGFSGFEDAYFGEPNNEDAVLTEAPAYSARTSYSFSGTPTEDALRSSSLRRVHLHRQDVNTSLEVRLADHEPLINDQECLPRKASNSSVAQSETVQLGDHRFEGAFRHLKARHAAPIQICPFCHRKGNAKWKSSEIECPCRNPLRQETPIPHAKDHGAHLMTEAEARTSLIVLHTEAEAIDSIASAPTTSDMADNMSQLRDVNKLSEVCMVERGCSQNSFEPQSTALAHRAEKPALRTRSHDPQLIAEPQLMPPLASDAAVSMPGTDVQPLSQAHHRLPTSQAPYPYRTACVPLHSPAVQASPRPPPSLARHGQAFMTASYTHPSSIADPYSPSPHGVPQYAWQAWSANAPRDTFHPTTQMAATQYYVPAPSYDLAPSFAPPPTYYPPLALSPASALDPPSSSPNYPVDWRPTVLITTVTHTHSSYQAPLPPPSYPPHYRTW